MMSWCDLLYHIAWLNTNIKDEPLLDRDMCMKLCDGTLVLCMGAYDGNNQWHVSFVKLWWQVNFAVGT